MQGRREVVGILWREHRPALEGIVPSASVLFPFRDGMWNGPETLSNLLLSLQPSEFLCRFFIDHSGIPPNNLNDFNMGILTYKIFALIESGMPNSLFNLQRAGGKFALVSYSPGICNVAVLMHPLYIKQGHQIITAYSFLVKSIVFASYLVNIYVLSVCISS